MLSFSPEQLNGLMAYVLGFLWPLSRILGLFAAAPGFSNRGVPGRIRLGMGLAITICIAPALPPMPSIDPLSAEGLALLVQQLLIGLAIGLVMRLVFTGLEFAGELMSSTMGLGFAQFFDPQSAGRTTVVSQFLGVLALLFWFTSDLHLVLIETLVLSFQSLPVSSTALPLGFFSNVMNAGRLIFSIALQISLPVVTILLLVNLAMGVLTRSAPQLNLFGVGFPVTLSAGFLVIAASIPVWMQPIILVLRQGSDLVRQMMGV